MRKKKWQVTEIKRDNGRICMTIEHEESVTTFTQKIYIDNPEDYHVGQLVTVSVEPVV